MSGTVGNIHVADIVVIVIYFAFVLFVGLYTSSKNRGTVGGYFLAGRTMHYALVGASLFASNVGSLHFVGLASSGVEAGISVAIYEINAIFVLMMLGWLFLPVYLISGRFFFSEIANKNSKFRNTFFNYLFNDTKPLYSVFTMPEYVRRRFGGQRIRIYLAVLSLVVYIFTKISADLYAGAIFIEQALGWDLYASIGFLLLIAAIFTIMGGLTAVMWTDFIQTCIMIVGSLALMFIAFAEVGGFDNMTYKYERAVPNTTFHNPNTTCGYPREDYLHFIRDAKTGDVPWPGLVGVTINSIWYWCADQVIVQRTLSAKNYTHAKAGCLIAGYIKLLPLFIIVFPGMIARILYPDEVACTDADICMSVCSSPSGCSNIAYPLLVIDLLPAGARGVMLAVMLSALMSSLTSIFNSSSTIFTIDIWRKIRRKATPIELMIVGRLCVIVLVVISILWIPIIQASQSSNLFVYIQQVSSYFQPPICAIYMLGIFWGRINEKGAFWSLVLGLIIGMVRMILDFTMPPPPCDEEDTRPAMIKDFHYLYFAMCLYAFTALVAIGISLLTDPIPEKHLYRLTWWSRHSTEPREDIDQDSVLDAEGALEGVEEDGSVTQKTDDADEDSVFEKMDDSDDESGVGTRVDTDVVEEKGQLDDESVVGTRVDTDVVEEKGQLDDESVVGTRVDTDVVEEKGQLDEKEMVDNSLTYDDTADLETSDTHSTHEKEKTPCWRTAFNYICGIEKYVEQPVGPEAQKLEEDRVLSIAEKPRWKKLAEINAYILCFVTLFLAGFFA